LMSRSLGGLHANVSSAVRPKFEWVAESYRSTTLSRPPGATYGGDKGTSTCYATDGHSVIAALFAPASIAPGGVRTPALQTSCKGEVAAVQARSAADCLNRRIRATLWWPRKGPDQSMSAHLPWRVALRDGLRCMGCMALSSHNSTAADSSQSSRVYESFS
jgi:hypothetical protein